LPRQEGLDDAHAAATARAGMLSRFRLFGHCSLDGIDRDEWNCEQVTDACNILGAGWAGQQAIVTDAIKALWQQCIRKRRMNSWVSSVITPYRSRPSGR